MSIGHNLVGVDAKFTDIGLVRHLYFTRSLSHLYIQRAVMQNVEANDGSSLSVVDSDHLPPPSHSPSPPLIHTYLRRLQKAAGVKAAAAAKVKAAKEEAAKKAMVSTTDNQYDHVTYIPFIHEINRYACIQLKSAVFMLLVLFLKCFFLWFLNIVYREDDAMMCQEADLYGR